MKSDLEKLSDTRVKFTVELPFDDLTDAVDDAYKRIAGQVQIPGFRKGKVPRQIIDQRFGRGVVLEEVVNSQVPQAYEEAVRESGVVALGQPQVEVTDIVDGERIAFTAEVDIRPEFDLPEYKGLRVEVEPLEVTDADVDEQLDELRARFGSYSEVERAAQAGDVLLVDTSAELKGDPIEDLAQQAVSYEIGKDGMVPGMDDAVIGATAGESRTFEFVPTAGEFEGQPITVTVTVQAVRERVLPPLDDDLAMMASEFDTLDELRADLRERLSRGRLMERGADARTKLHDQLIAAAEIPVPEGVIQAEVDDHFADHGDSDDDHRAEVEADARKNLQSQFLLDRIADAEELAVGEAELSQWLVMQAPRYGMSPDQFAQALVEAGQVPMAVGEVRRTKALAFVLESAEIVDTNGEPVDLAALSAGEGDSAADAAGEAAGEAGAEADAEGDAEGEAGAEGDTTA